MTPHRLALLLLPVIALSSCDKLKSVAKGVGDSLEDRMSDDVEEVTENNPLNDFIDKNEEGVVFRKDLEFPTEVKVLTRKRMKIDGRVFTESELGKKVDNVNGKESIDVKFERNGSTVNYTIVKAEFAIPNDKPVTEDGEEAGPIKIKNPFSQQQPITKTLSFSNSSGSWKGKSGRGDFKIMALNQQLEPVFEDMVIDNALKPRKLWFSPKRIKVGDEVAVTDAAMPMIIAGKVKGELKLKLEGFEEVKGHPCGVFSVSGKFSRKKFPDLEGRLVDQDVTVESGKLWLSLLYPLVLKERMKTIQTFKPSEGGSISGRGQGTVEHIIEREWIAALPEVEEPEVEAPKGDEPAPTE